MDQPVRREELAWLDAPVPGLLRLAWPIVVSMLSASVMTLVDTLFVSTLGTWALAGVGLGGICTFIIVCFPLGSLGAVKILTSQSVGAGRLGNVQTYLGAGLALAVVMGVAAIAVALGAAQVIHHAAASDETAGAARTYIRIAGIGAIPFLLRIAIEQTRLSLGDSHSPMRVALFANVCNVGLNYVFIFVLELGVAGAAWGTLGANVVGCVAMVAVQLRRGGIHPRGTRRHHIEAVWSLGLPTGLQMLLEMGAFGVMVVMLTNLSDRDGAANQIAIQVLHFGFLPCMAISEAASIMVGQAVGAGRRDLVHVVAKGALLPIFWFTAAMAAIFVFGGDFIAAAFTKDPELAALAARLLIVAAVFQFADGVNILARSVLRGTGDVQFCARLGIAISWGMTPPLTWLFGYYLGLGAFGGWIGLCIDIFVGSSIFWWRLRSDRWHHAADATTREVAASGALSPGD
jgi:MATE family multidrug resistance protein